MEAFSTAALKIFENHFLKRDALSKTVETPRELFQRVARTVAQAELAWGSRDEVEYYQDEYYRMMKGAEFFPDISVLLKAGLEKANLLSSFVLPVSDSIDGISKALREMKTLHEAGGRVGFSFSSLRPRYDDVTSTRGDASGPVAFMQLFEQACRAQEGGDRAPSAVATLAVDHPDILALLEAKEAGVFSQLKLYVGVTSHFMRCLKKDTTYPLVNPRNKKIVKFISAVELFENLCRLAAQRGGMGLFFVDEANRHQPTPGLGNLEAAGPLGYELLLPYESCSVGAIHLAALVKDRSLDEERLEILIDLAVRFLDNVLEISHYPLMAVQTLTQATRKLGLGIFGLPEMLQKLDIPYASGQARRITSTLMKFFFKRCRQSSMALAKQRGAFANYAGSSLQKKKLAPVRNATLTAVASDPMWPVLAGLRESVENFAENGRRQDKSDLWRIRATLQKYSDHGVEPLWRLPSSAAVKDFYELYLAAYAAHAKMIWLEPEARSQTQRKTPRKAASRAVQASAAYGSLVLRDVQ